MSVPQAVSTRRFRDALALLAAPMTIVATRDAHGEPRGMTASSVTSVSLDPPLVLVCVARGSRSLDALVGAGKFTVNILSARHESLARRFASVGEDRFAGCGFESWQDSDIPYLPDAQSALYCVLADRKRAGDHDVLFGLVVGVADGDGAQPLIWYRRRAHLIEETDKTVFEYQRGQ